MHHSKAVSEVKLTIGAHELRKTVMTHKQKLVLPTGTVIEMPYCAHHLKRCNIIDKDELPR